MKKKKLKKQKQILSNEEVWGLVAAGSAMLAGIVVRSFLNRSWKAITKQNPPLNPAARNTSWKEAIVWTVASGVAVSVAELIARRGADALWTKVAGQKPEKQNATLGGL